MDQDCNNSYRERKIRGSIDSLAIDRYQKAIEIAQKLFFKGEKNTELNAIKHATQPKIHNILSSQNHFSSRKMTSI